MKRDKDISNDKTCPICDLGHETKKVLFIPVKDENGIVKDKYLRVVEGGKLYKMILGDGNKLPNCWIVDEGSQLYIKTNVDE